MILADVCAWLKLYWYKTGWKKCRSFQTPSNIHSKVTVASTIFRNDDIAESSFFASLGISTCAILLIVRMNPLSRSLRSEHRSGILNETVTWTFSRIDSNILRDLVLHPHPCNPRSSENRSMRGKRNREWQSRLDFRLWTYTCATKLGYDSNIATRLYWECSSEYF